MVSVIKRKNMQKKFDIQSLGQNLATKIIVVLKQTCKDNKHILYQFYNMYYGDNTVSGSHIDNQAKILRYCGHQVSEFTLYASQLSKEVLKTINTDQPIKVYVDKYNK